MDVIPNEIHTPYTNRWSPDSRKPCDRDVLAHIGQCAFEKLSKHLGEVTINRVHVSPYTVSAVTLL